MIDMIVAITTVQSATITKALSFIDRLDDFLYLPEVMCIMIFIWLISSGSGQLSIDHWIAARSVLLEGVPADRYSNRSRTPAAVIPENPRPSLYEVEAGTKHVDEVIQNVFDKKKGTQVKNGL